MFFSCKQLYKKSTTNINHTNAVFASHLGDSRKFCFSFFLLF